MPRSPVAIARILATLATAALVATGCTSGTASPSAAGSTSTPSASGGASPGASVTPTSLTVGLGYIPSVQFAPFYLAQQAGYYQAAGLNVTFQNKIETDLVLLVGQGAIDLGVADGTDVIPAVSQGVPVRYISTLYGTYPSIVFAKASSGITSAADLKGRKIGIPGKYGSSWIMLQALLGSAGLKPSDATIQEYPDFGQGVAVQQGAVDAATGFANNEPVQLELAGTKTVVLHVDSTIALPGPGLIAGVSTLSAKHDAVLAFVAATIRAMNEILFDSSSGVDAAIKAVPELGANRATQEAILKATMATWLGPVTGTLGLGAIDEDGWTKSIAFMTSLGLVPKAVTLADVVQEGFVPIPSK